MDRWVPSAQRNVAGVMVSPIALYGVVCHSCSSPSKARLRGVHQASGSPASANSVTSSTISSAGSPACSGTEYRNATPSS